MVSILGAPTLSIAVLRDPVAKPRGQYLSTVVAVLLAASVASPSYAIRIDDFSEGATTIRREFGEPRATDTQSGLPVDSVIGGTRDVTLGARDYIRGSIGAVRVAVDTNAQQLVYDTDPGITGVNFYVQYGSVEEPLHANFAADRADRIRFEFQSTAFRDPAFLDIMLITQSDETTAGSLGGSIGVQIPSTDQPQIVDVSLDDFSNAKDLDLKDVWSVSFGTGNGRLPGTFVLTSVHTVPEPSALLTLSVVSTVILCRRRL